MPAGAAQGDPSLACRRGGTAIPTAGKQDHPISSRHFTATSRKAQCAFCRELGWEYVPVPQAMASPGRYAASSTAAGGRAVGGRRSGAARRPAAAKLAASGRPAPPYSSRLDSRLDAARRALPLRHTDVKTQGRSVVVFVEQLIAVANDFHRDAVDSLEAVGDEFEDGPGLQFRQCFQHGYGRVGSRLAFHVEAVERAVFPIELRHRAPPPSPPFGESFPALACRCSCAASPTHGGTSTSARTART